MALVFASAVLSLACLAPIGLNCALGTEQMRPYVQAIGKLAPTFVSAHPNAGLPNELGDYDQGPEYMAGLLTGYARDGLINIIGGCCGTTPDPWLTVYSAQGAQLATNDDGGGCGYQSDLSVMIPAGRVYVEVKPFNWTPTRTGNYQLYAEIP